MVRTKDLLRFIIEHGGECYLPPPKKSGKPRQYYRNWLIEIAHSINGEKFYKLQEDAFKTRKKKAFEKRNQLIRVAKDVQEILAKTNLFST